MKPRNRFQLLLWQYRECISYIRHLDSLIWQTPSTTMAINTFMGILYLRYAKTFESKIIVLSASFAFTFVAWIAIQKHRFHQEAKNEEFSWIQNELLTMFENVREIRLRTEEIFDDRENYPTVNRNWFRERGAYRWLSFSLYGTLIVLAILIEIEIIRFICHLN